ncbi:hypothetical protein Droror1_Dr00023573 [Drosera rotundifolia]
MLTAFEVFTCKSCSGLGSVGACSSSTNFERPLKTIAIRCGDVYIPCGVVVPALDKDILWEFQPKKLDLREPFNLQKGWLMFFCNPVSPIIFPADLLFLASTNADGVCYIETSNLDGETNLKIRKALKKTWDYLTPEKATEFEGEVQCEQP